MIPQAKLMALSVETLIALQSSIKEVLMHKQRTELRIGTKGHIKTTKRIGGIQRLQITGFGPKNLKACEIDDHGNVLLGSRWTVHPTFFVPDAKVVAAPPAKYGAGRDAPAILGSF